MPARGLQGTHGRQQVPTAAASKLHAETGFAVVLHLIKEVNIFAADAGRENRYLEIDIIF
jgi:hypothetical protein